MAEPKRASALFGRANRFERSSLSLIEVRPSAIALINGAPDEPGLLEALRIFNPVGELKPHAATQGDAMALLWQGPRQWLAVAVEAAPEAFLSALRNALAGTHATVTDLSHARTVVRAGGAGAQELLCRLCPVDIEMMREGACASTLLGHFQVLVHRLGAETFDLYALRSFGLAFWQALEHEAATLVLERGGAP